MLHQTDYLRRAAGVLGTELAGAWETLRDTALDAWGGIQSALARGDLASAGRIALAGLEVVWRDSLLRLMRMWVGFRVEIVSVFSAMGDVIADIWDRVTYGIQRKFTDALAGLFSKAGGLASLIGADSLAGELNEFSRAARLASQEIEQEQGRSLASRQKAFDAALAARQAAGAAELAPFEAAADAARAAMKTLLAEERARDLEAGRKALAPPKLADRFTRVGEVLGQATKGTFNASGIGLSLGVGDTIAVRQYEVMKETRDAVKRVEEAVRQGGGVFGDD